MNEKALVGLTKILLLSDPKDVKILEIKTVPGMPKSKSRREAIGYIVHNSDTPTKLLRQPTIKKSILKKYLKETGIADPKDAKKDDCIRSCLESWGIEDDTMQKYRTESEILEELNRLDAQEKKKIEKIKLEYAQKKQPLMDLRKAIRRRSSVSTSQDAASSTLVSPSCSANPKFCFTQNPSLKKRKKEPDDVSIIMKKQENSPAKAVKVEHIRVTPDIKPEIPARVARPPTPDSSDTSTIFWVNW